MTDRREVLLSSLSGGASERTWSAVCKLLDAWKTSGEPGFLDAIALVEEETADWPDAAPFSPRRGSYPRVDFRRPPANWLRGMMQGGDEPEYRLVRDLCYGGATGKSTAHLFTSEHLTRICHLVLPNNKLPGRFYKNLATSANFQHLTSLTIEKALYRASIGRNIRLLAEHPSLTHLSFSLVEFKDDGWQQVFSGADWGRLVDLRVHHPWRSVGLFEALAPVSGSFPALRRLQLKSVQMTDAVAETLFAEGALPDLEYLNLSRNELTAAGLEAVLAGRSGLEVLLLNDNPLGEDGAAVLLGATHLTRLKTLHLRTCGIPAAVLERLRQAPHLQGLASLEA